jgi:hypothetical protein
MHTRSVLLVAAAVLFGGVLLVEARTRDGGAALARADPALTPGVLNPQVAQSTIGETICVRGWTSTIRPPSEYTSALKEEQMRERGLPGGPGDYQEDHLISLGLGGHPTDPRNLWPQPIARALEIDRIEVELHDRICAGELTLAEAQRREAALKHDHG